MEKKVLDTITVFNFKDLPNEDLKLGFSLYKGVLIQWSKDEKLKPLIFIDLLLEDERDNLAVIYIECEAQITECGSDDFEDKFYFIWKDNNLVHHRFYAENYLVNEANEMWGKVCMSKGPDGNLVSEKPVNSANPYQIIIKDERPF